MLKSLFDRVRSGTRYTGGYHRVEVDHRVATVNYPLNYASRSIVIRHYTGQPQNATTAEVACSLFLTGISRGTFLGLPKKCLLRTFMRKKGTALSAS